MDLSVKEMQPLTTELESHVSRRLISLDVMRGITIVGMILVNTPGTWAHIYPPLEHAEWNGLTPTDLVFPFFLFMVGIAITLAFRKRIDAGASKADLMKKVTKRAIIIFVLGLFLWLFPTFDFSNIRIPGVLQRIALVYFFCSLIFLNTPSWKAQVTWATSLLVIYWILMTMIPVPGYGEPMLDPGKNLAAWLDSLLIPGTMWQGTWDPEGVLSTMPSIVTGITGILAGYLILSAMTAERKIIWMMVMGTISLLAGYLWGLDFPVNKNLWTSSYVLVSSGMAFLLLGTLYWFVDVLNYKKWTPFFVAFGSNAITAYVIHGVLADIMGLIQVSEDKNFRQFTYEGLVHLGLGLEAASFLWAILYVLLCFIPIWIMYKKHIIVKI
jgi:predicted acyltransferase